MSAFKESLDNHLPKVTKGLAWGALKGATVGGLLFALNPLAGAVGAGIYYGKSMYNAYRKNPEDEIHFASALRKYVLGNKANSNTNNTGGSLLGNLWNGGNTTSNNPNQSPEDQLEGELLDIEQMIARVRNNSSNIDTMRIERRLSLMEIINSQYNKLFSSPGTYKSWKLGKNKPIPSLKEKIQSISNIQKRMDFEDKLYQYEDEINNLKDKLEFLSEPDLEQIGNIGGQKNNFIINNGDDLSFKITNIPNVPDVHHTGIYIRDENGHVIRSSFDQQTKEIIIKKSDIKTGKHTISYSMFTRSGQKISSREQGFSVINNNSSNTNNNSSNTNNNSSNTNNNSSNTNNNSSNTNNNSSNTNNNSSNTNNNSSNTNNNSSNTNNNSSNTNNNSSNTNNNSSNTNIPNIPTQKLSEYNDEKYINSVLTYIYRIAKEIKRTYPGNIDNQLRTIYEYLGLGKLQDINYKTIKKLFMINIHPDVYSKLNNKDITDVSTEIFQILQPILNKLQ